MASVAHKVRTRNVPRAGLVILFNPSRQKSRIALASSSLGGQGKVCWAVTLPVERSMRLRVVSGASRLVSASRRIMAS